MSAALKWGVHIFLGHGRFTNNPTYLLREYGDDGYEPRFQAVVNKHAVYNKRIDNVGIIGCSIALATAIALIIIASTVNMPFFAKVGLYAAGGLVPVISWGSWRLSKQIALRDYRKEYKEVSSRR